MVEPVEADLPAEVQDDDKPAALEPAAPTQEAPEPQLAYHDPYRISPAALDGMPAVSRILWHLVDAILQALFRTVDYAASVRHRLAPEPSRSRGLVDASHPTWARHRLNPSGTIEAEYRIFIPVRSAARLECAADLVLRHLRNWRTFYRRSHVEFLGPEPDQSTNTPVTFKFAPLAPWGKKYTGREVTVLTVSFASREPLPDRSGWVMKGTLIDGYDENGQRLPHHFTGPVQTEVRVINEPADQDRAARVGIEVRDIWVDVWNHKPISDFVATKVHLFRSADGFGGLRKIMAKELKDL